MNKSEKNIYSIPAGLPFARILAHSLLEQTQDSPEMLSRFLIFMPSRRACRLLQESFFKLQTDRPVLLPRLMPIGDIEDEDIVSTPVISEKILSRLQRQIILSKLIRTQNPQYPAEHALALAQALGTLMDQVYTENLSLCSIEKLVPADFANHWQITIDFLKILSEYWPKILQEKQSIDFADSRNRLILQRAEEWIKNPPSYPVIAAGSTGSIPATAQLLSVIAHMKTGKVILPGYDFEIDEDSWQALDETHPQYGFKKLLKHMNAERDSIKEWPCSEFKFSHHAQRLLLAREIMRPSATSYVWSEIRQNKNIQKKLLESCETISVFNCKNENEEANVIALSIRKVLEIPNKTVCLITPDRNLAMRVQAICRRWDLNIDDSAGQNFIRTPLGQFFMLVYKAYQTDFSPLILLALLKNKFANFNFPPDKFENTVQTLDLLLRGLKPETGLAALRAHIEHFANISAEEKQQVLDLVDAILKAFMPLHQQNSKEHVSFSDMLIAHIQTSENCAAKNNDTEQSVLWSSYAGQTAYDFFENVLTLDDLDLLGDNTLRDTYESLFVQLIKPIIVRPPFDIHPRVHILGQIEARLIDYDLVILGGLNEGTWPSNADIDPWMSRPMRRTFGLPSLERKVGLEAHDFVQALSSREVILTRSIKSGHALSVPARWLQRFYAVLEGSGLDYQSMFETSEILYWARNLDYMNAAERIKRPQPCPPLNKRPKCLPVTRIETWLKDPYSIYVRYILQLKKLKDIEQKMDAALFGDLLHEILQTFVKKYPDALPEDIQKTLKNIAAEKIKKYDQKDSVWDFWWPKFERMVSWLEIHEKQWRKSSHFLACEEKGTIKIQTEHGDFELYGFVDRIDKYRNGNAVIIDYKSAGSFTLSGMASGDFPQLPLEAILLEKGGFKILGPMNVDSLQYWILNGKGAGGECKILHEDLTNIIEKTYQGLVALIENYQNPDSKYIALPHAEYIPRYNDYIHLERVQEWAANELSTEGDFAV